MNALEIKNLLDGYRGFLGVFPRDKLPIKLNPKTFLIFNTDTSDKPGQHWIGIYVRNKEIVEHFDPLGRQPSHDLQQYYTKIGFSKVVYPTYQIQHTMAITCGLHCIVFLKKRIKGMTMNQILTRYYTTHRLYNECLVLSEFF